MLAFLPKMKVDAVQLRLIFLRVDAFEDCPVLILRVLVSAKRPFRVRTANVENSAFLKDAERVSRK